jgi:hypothetical protein
VNAPSRNVEKSYAESSVTSIRASVTPGLITGVDEGGRQ